MASWAEHYPLWKVLPFRGWFEDSYCCPDQSPAPVRPLPNTGVLLPGSTIACEVSEYERPSIFELVEEELQQRALQRVCESEVYPVAEAPAGSLASSSVVSVIEDSQSRSSMVPGRGGRGVCAIPVNRAAPVSKSGYLVKKRYRKRSDEK